MKGSEFTIDSVDLLYYHLNKISLGRKGRSYIDSPKWLKNKKATINPKNNDDNCFQYAIIAALNHKQIKNQPERISNLKPFIDQYDWKGINFPPKQEKDWKKLESDKKSIAINILFVPYNTEEIARAYTSKYNHKRENKVILSMITDSEKWHYLAVKSLSALQIIMETFIAYAFIRTVQKIDLKIMKKYVMTMIIVTYKCLMKTTKY